MPDTMPGAGSHVSRRGGSMRGEGGAAGVGGYVRVAGSHVLLVDEVSRVEDLEILAGRAIHAAIHVLL